MNLARSGPPRHAASVARYPARMRTRCYALLFLVTLGSGCLAKQLRTPAEDHYVQTKHIADSCAKGAYGTCTPELKEDLEAMAEQACLLNAITRGTDGAECKGEDQ